MDNPIAEAKTRLGLTTDGIAKRLGVHRTTVGRWERGEVPISGPAAKLIEEILLGGEAEQRRKPQ